MNIKTLLDTCRALLRLLDNYYVDEKINKRIEIKDVIIIDQIIR